MYNINSVANMYYNAGRARNGQLWRRGWLRATYMYLRRVRGIFRNHYRGVCLLCKFIIIGNKRTAFAV